MHFFYFDRTNSFFAKRRRLDWLFRIPAPPPSPRQRCSYLLPLSLLVEHDDHQLGVLLVAVLGERQVSAVPRHIHHVPESGGGAGEGLEAVWRAVIRRQREEMIEGGGGRDKKEGEGRR